MPTGPKGERRPADVIGAAIMVAKIATGEINERLEPKNAEAVALGKRGGAKGGKARGHCQCNGKSSEFGTAYPNPSGDYAARARHSANAAKRLCL